MGTRGYRIVRCRGRYWVFFNRYDSYPEHLGSSLLASVPIDPEVYRVWLKEQFEFYDAQLAELEEAFSITEGHMQDLLTTNEAGPVWKQIVSAEQLPSPFCEVSNDLFIEWVYLMDLDNEAFSVNNTIFFELSNIPRDRWLRAFEVEESYSTTVCPEASFNPIIPMYFADAEERDMYNETYRKYSCSKLGIDSKVDIHNASIQQNVTVMLLECFLQPYRSRFWEYLPQWGPEDFAFQELAFAVLSLAAGEYYLLNPDELYGHYEFVEKSHGFIVSKTPDNKAEMFPIFGQGCHSPGQEAGSAPPGSMYFFEGVLISLVAPKTLQMDADAAIAKAVEFGVQEGKTHFRIVVFSILTAIFLKVSVEDGVKLVRHTGIIPVTVGLQFQDNILTPSPPAAGTELSYQAHPGFAVLQDLFDTETSGQFLGFTQGVFPTEIYAEILSYIDPPTQLACSKVSKIFRSLCQKRFPLNNKLAIIKFKASAYRHRGVMGQILDGFGTFTFQGTEKTANVSRSSFNPSSPAGPEKNCTRWCPVIGTGARKSVITQTFLGIALD
ncbi:hypothetical protein FQN49_005234 [Arthroderma sp. PD_2]|nr:hypothetical protein FQN49_005234 [Arthroderma sp. PD_2]